jgi:hypothetical protein
MRFAQIFIAAMTVFSVPAPAINVGDTAPTFSLSTYGGGTFNPDRQRGKVTVLLFLCYQ